MVSKLSFLHNKMNEDKFYNLRKSVEKFASRFKNESFRKLFIDCFFNTIDSTAFFEDDKSVFVITGDIPAMWLRDSSAQVLQYLFFAEDEEVRFFIKGLLKRQFQMILIDPYANAFMRDETYTSEWEGMVTSDYLPKIVWERKFELDSLCYPLFLLSKYFDKTGDKEVFDELFFKAFDKIIETIEKERKHSEKSSYFFHFYREADQKKVDVGDNNPNSEKGLIWSGFRPSDDACEYHYHIPDNMFATSILNKFAILFDKILFDVKRARICRDLVAELRTLIDKYGVVEDKEYGRVYVSETDCIGNYHIKDDANIPSLLSLPYLEYPYLDEEVYENTRKLILSKRNPYYYSGSVLEGIGSPHTPFNRVWPLAIAMQAITSEDEKEINRCIDMLVASADNTGYMHEGVDCNDTGIYSRPWFAWANSLFAYLVVLKADVLKK